MNSLQLRKIKSLTDQITRDNLLNSGDWLNGPVVFQVEVDRDPVFGDTIWFRATNTTEEKSWFESAVWFNASIGPRGGLRVYSAEGVRV